VENNSQKYSNRRKKEVWKFLISRLLITGNESSIRVLLSFFIGHKFHYFGYVTFQDVANGIDRLRGDGFIVHKSLNGFIVQIIRAALVAQVVCADLPGG